MKLGFFNKQNLRRFEIAARKASFSIKVFYALFSTSLVLALLTYASFVYKSSYGLILTLIIATIITLILLVLMIASRLVKIFVRRKQGAAGARFHSRLVIVFSILAVTPTVLIYFMSSALFEKGVQALVGNFTQHTVEKVISISENLKNSLKHNLQETITDVAQELWEDPTLLFLPEEQLQKKLLHLQNSYSLSNIFLVQKHTTISAKNNEIFYSNIAPASSGTWETLFEKKFISYFSLDKKFIVAAYTLDQDAQRFLFVSQAIEPYLPIYFQDAHETAQKYADIQKNRWHIRFMFMLIYGLFALLSLIIAIGAGIMFADHIAKPIGQLISAAQRIRRGDLTTRVQIEPNIVEFLGLAKTFNQMVTELQQQKEKLEAANSELNRRKRFIETTLKGLTSAVIGLDKNNNIKVVNDAALKVLKINEPPSKETHIVDIFPEIKDFLYEQSQKNLTDEQISNLSEKLLLIDRNSSLYYLSIHITTTNNDRDPIQKVITVDDITDLHLAQKKAAWGDVARRVAHEIKNPLTPIQLSAEQLKRKISKLLDTNSSEPLIKNIETIIRQVDEIKNIVHAFSQLSRMPQPVLNEHDVLDIIKTNTSLQRSAYENIQFTEILPPSPTYVLCDPHLLSQAFNNILKNAIESLQDSASEGLQQTILIELTIRDKSVTITVEDNGKGFPKNMIERCLDPYITTKKQGTGLGLAITKKIIDDHNGSLELKNTPNGAQVVVVLPLCKLESSE